LPGTDSRHQIPDQDGESQLSCLRGPNFGSGRPSITTTSGSGGRCPDDALTADIDRSRRFYDDVFGFTVAYEMPADADAPTREALGFLFGGVIYHVGDGLFGLRPVAGSSDRFDEDRVGLDHVSFALPGRADLDATAAVLDDQGIAHGGIKDIGVRLHPRVPRPRQHRPRTLRPRHLTDPTLTQASPSAT